MAFCLIRTNSCSILAFTEDDDNQELMDLIQSFRVEASKLLGMLDVSNATVARLKVLSLCYCMAHCYYLSIYRVSNLLQSPHIVPTLTACIM
jgi:hypothetical protein